MADSDFEVTRTHLENAHIYGEHRARRHIEDGITQPLDDLWSVLDRDDVVFRITGEKNLLGDVTAMGYEILDTVENSYYDYFDEHES